MEYGIKISVIVPVYNTEQYIGECIESAINQGYKNFELILVDDGSTDSSGRICDEYANIDKRIKVFHINNSGQAKARYYGVDRADGDYIVFLDSDDLLANRALEVICEKIRCYRCDLLIYRAELFADRPTVEKEHSGEDVIITDRKILYTTILYNESYNSMCIKAVKRNLIVDGEYEADVRYGEDLLQTLSIIKRVAKTVIIPKTLYHYRKRPDSITRSLRLDRYSADIVSVRNTVYRFLKDADVLNDDEMAQYKSIAARILMEGVSNIARAECEFRLKRELLEGIRKNEYCQELMSAGICYRKALGNKRIVWALFRKKMYYLISLLFLLK